MSRKAKNIVGGLVGFLIALGVGVAFALTLSTSISGQATIRTAPPTEPEPVSARTVSASGTNDGALDCRQVGASGDSSNITFKPVLTRPADGQTGNESCKVTLTVRNTGTTTLTAAPSSGFNAPAGWSVGAITGTAVTGPITPGQVKSATVTVTASPTATAGEFSGRLDFTDGR